MPIVNCFINRKTSKNIFQNLIEEWITEIQIDKKDICFNILTNTFQVGQFYEVIVNLYLPSIWSKNDIKKIQLGLMNLIVKHLELNFSEVLLITSIIQSGNVIDNGKIINW